VIIVSLMVQFKEEVFTYFDDLSVAEAADQALIEAETAQVQDSYAIAIPAVVGGAVMGGHEHHEHEERPSSAGELDRPQLGAAQHSSVPW
jgi:hypothetical protein